MRVIDTRMVLGLSVWILGFVLMTAGWLVDELFETRGELAAKILRKTGAFIVATPVIILLWKAAAYLYVHRVDVSLFVNSALNFISETLKVL